MRARHVGAYASPFLTMQDPYGISRVWPFGCRRHPAWVAITHCTNARATYTGSMKTTRSSHATPRTWLNAFSIDQDSLRFVINCISSNLKNRHAGNQPVHCHRRLLPPGFLRPHFDSFTRIKCNTIITDHKQKSIEVPIHHDRPSMLPRKRKSILLLDRLQNCLLIFNDCFQRLLVLQNGSLILDDRLLIYQD
jgi:hypothetical protein